MMTRFKGPEYIGLSGLQVNAKYLGSMRPAVHHHRIIKDKSADAIKAHPAGLLHPLPHHLPAPNNPSHHLHHLHHGGDLKNAILPGLPRIDAGSEREQTSQLHKRIKELEKENFQLNHHVQQAEQSLRNYRELMANNLNKNYEPHTTKNENKPNGSIGSAPQQQQQHAALQQNVLQLESQLKDAQKQISDLTKQKSTFQNKLDDYLKQIRDIDQLKQDYACLKQSHVHKEQDIKRLQDEVHALKQQADHHHHHKHHKHDPNTLKKLMQVVDQLKKELWSTKQALSTQASTVMQSAIDDVSQIYERCNESNFFWKDVVQKKTSEMIVMKVEYEKERRDLQEEILRLQQAVGAGPEEREVVDMNVGTSPEKPMFSTPAGKKASTGIAIGTTPGPNGVNMGTMMTPMPQKANPSEKREVFCSPLLDWKLHELNEESMKKKLQASEMDVSKLKREVDAANITIRFFHEKLQTANKAVSSLQEVHQGEIKAIKHLAHIKELLRVAKEREQSIDKDRLSLEVKQLKEIQNVLTFSLNTAEQSLAESQPHTVAKLVEGRSKRIKLIEHSFKGKMKDIEQRSAETCAVNTTHLEQFQKKAVDNEKNAESMSKNATESLLSCLKV